MFSDNDHTDSFDPSSARELIFRAMKSTASTACSPSWLLELIDEDEYLYPERRTPAAVEANLKFIQQRYLAARDMEIYGGRRSDVGRKAEDIASDLSNALQKIGKLNQVELRVLSMLFHGPASDQEFSLMRVAHELAPSGLHGVKHCERPSDRPGLNVAHWIEKITYYFATHGRKLKASDVGGRNQYAAHILGPPADHQLVNDLIRLLEYCGLSPTMLPRGSRFSGCKKLLLSLVDQIACVAAPSSGAVTVSTKKIAECIKARKVSISTLTELRTRYIELGYSDFALHCRVDHIMGMSPIIKDLDEFAYIEKYAVRARECRNDWLRGAHFRPDDFFFDDPAERQRRGWNPS